MGFLWRRNCFRYCGTFLLSFAVFMVYMALLRQNKIMPSRLTIKPELDRPNRGDHDTFDNVHKKFSPVKPGDKKTPMNVFVVEEHHEVIPYWFNAANTGQLSTYGNTLIHIDGHSDLAPPTYFPEYPMFRWPAEEEIRFLIQKNDAFIQSSSMASLVTRMIWVWPEWDRENHDDDYSLTVLSYGWIAVNTSSGRSSSARSSPKRSSPVSPGEGRPPGSPGSGRKKRMFCECEKNDTATTCRYQDTGDDGDWIEVPVPEKYCHVQKVLIFEAVNERRALEYFKKDHDWISKSESVILDIDEDFFGCSYVIEPLLEVNVTMDTVEDINESIQDLYCPGTTVREGEADRVLVSLLSKMISQKACERGLTRDNCPQKLTEDEAVTILNQQILVCEVSEYAKESARDVFNKLRNLNLEQLQVLRQIGFCSSTTPKTYPIFGSSAFGICYGANTPSDSAVTEFTPSHDNLQMRAALLRKLLNSISKFSPGIVTLCRSMRDGYTPRHHFEQIERVILTSLDRTFSSGVSVHYDRDLLGGRLGWPGRLGRY